MASDETDGGSRQQGPLGKLLAHIPGFSRARDESANEPDSPVPGPNDIDPPIVDPKSHHVRSPFIVHSPNSEQADREGLQEGDLLSKYAEDAAALKIVQSQLQHEVDAQIQPGTPKIKIGITHFKNWGGTQDSLLLLAKPVEKEQVIALVKAAAKLGVKVGMGGSYHTWSSTYPDLRGLLINTCDLKLEKKDTTDQCRRIDLNKTKTAVTISPGVTTGELMRFFLDHNICFESDVLLSTVTYGGVLSGGCHGTGKDQQSMSDWIISLKLVDGSGNVRTLPKDEMIPPDSTVTPDEILKCAQVTLGLYGVVLEFTVQVKPMSNAEVHNIFDMRLEDVIPRDTIWEHMHLQHTHTKKLADLLDKYWSIELFWFPFSSLTDSLSEMLPDPNVPQLTLSTVSFSALHPAEAAHRAEEFLKTGNILPLLWTPWRDSLWIRGINIDRERKLEVTQEPGIPFWSRLTDVAVHSGGKYVLTPLMRDIPDATPISLMIGFQAVKMQYGTLQADKVVRTPWAIHYRDAIDIMRVYDIEFGFPIDIKHPVLAVKAVRKVIEITEKYAYEGKFPCEQKHQHSKEKVHFPLTLCMEMRVMKKSSALLCPASLGKEEHIAYIEVLSTSGTPGYEQYFTDVAKAWLDLGGVPHWQKQWEFLQKEKPDIFHYIRKKYGKNIDTFLKVRDQLNLDPNDLFMNDTMKQVLK